jgi:hypothetical protein
VHSKARKLRRENKPEPRVAAICGVDVADVAEVADAILLMSLMLSKGGCRPKGPFSMVVDIVEVVILVMLLLMLFIDVADVIY